MSVFEQYGNIDEAYGTEGGIYFPPGNYLAKIKRCKADRTKVTKKDYFVAELVVLESDNPEVKPGETRSFFVKFDEWPELSLGNVADFMRNGAAAWVHQNHNQLKSAKEIRLDKETEAAIIGPQQMLTGTVVRLFAFNKPKKNGEPFTRHQWMVPGAPNVEPVRNIYAAKVG